MRTYIATKQLRTLPIPLSYIAMKCIGSLLGDKHSHLLLTFTDTY